MLTNCLAACAHLTITVSEIQRDIGRKSSIFSYPPCIRRPSQGGSRWNSATPFGMEKLEWLGYHTVKKISKISLFVLAQLTNVTDKQTDGQTDGQTPRAGNSRAYAQHRAAKIRFHNHHKSTMIVSRRLESLHIRKTEKKKKRKSSNVYPVSTMKQGKMYHSVTNASNVKSSLFIRFETTV